MEKSQSTFLANITQADWVKMQDCLSGIRQVYEEGSHIPNTQGSTHRLAVVLCGNIRIERIDYYGNRSVIDRLQTNDLLGEVTAYASIYDDTLEAICETPCELLYLEHEKISHPCAKVCPCHTTLISNLLAMTTERAHRLSSHVEVLSSRSIREKLLRFFSLEAAKNGSSLFLLPFSISDLADYLCVDRSAMMRELRHMKQDGLLTTDRRKIQLL